MYLDFFSILVYFNVNQCLDQIILAKIIIATHYKLYWICFFFKLI